MNNGTSEFGTLYGIGVGPGDEELLTIKAVNTIKKCSVIMAPSAREGGKSTALSIAKNFIDKDKEIIIKHFPMGGDEQEKKIFDAFKDVEKRLSNGENVAFLTIGDPFVYSTYIYLLNYVKKGGYNAETVPGITSFCAAASLAGETLVIGNERVSIMTASQLHKITDEKFVVVMKVYGKEKEIVDFLERNNFKYVYVKRAYREGQEIIRDRNEILKNRDYMSLIIAHRK